MSPLRTATVLFVTGRVGPSLSRVERSWLPLMAALVAERANVLVVGAPRGPIVAPARALGATIAPYHVDRFNIWITRNRLRAYMKRHEPTVAFGAGYRADAPLRLAARGLPVKVVSSAHCGGWPPHGMGPLSTWGRRWMERRTRGRVDAFAVDCRGLADMLEADGIPAGAIHVIPPGIDIGTVIRDAAIAFEMPEGHPRVGYAGALERSRGLGTLATAAPAIRERHPEARVLVAGEGPARLGLLPASLDGRIELVGRPASVPAFLSTLDVCVFPSSAPGIPTSLLEAAALGRPIVACDVDGIREMFADGVEIALVPQGNAPALAEAVSALLDDPEHARTLGKAARLRAIDDYSAAAATRRGMDFIRTLSA
ncbi:MAG: glycosyltransferase family 4 protein [Coriobacteriia bacterium]|nr:glycosyltransferase family 4 protein [Coriobacteriia bacterium]